jgi:glycerol-3-phosphate dehydrogenase subunit B
MIAGDLANRDPMIIVGFEGYADFFPGLAADNLSARGYLVKEVVLDLPLLKKSRITTPILLARAFETEEFRSAVIKDLRARIGTARRVGLPAVLGIDKAQTVHKELESQLGCPVFEIPSLPPSIPGIRLHNLLVSAIQRAGGRVLNGIPVIDSENDGERIVSVTSEAAARNMLHRSSKYILSTGGLLGGGIVGDQDGLLRETVFDLPCVAPPHRADWFRPQFTDPRGHPVFRTGIVINDGFQPIDGDDKLIYENLYIVGTGLAGGEYLREASMEGVDLVTGYKVGRNLQS